MWVMIIITAQCQVMEGVTFIFRFASTAYSVDWELKYYRVQRIIYTRIWESFYLACMSFCTAPPLSVNK